jgi:hypothetical protein
VTGGDTASRPPAGEEEEAGGEEEEEEAGEAAAAAAKILARHEIVGPFQLLAFSSLNRVSVQA